MALSENGFKGEKAERIAVLKPLPGHGWEDSARAAEWIWDVTV